MKKVFLIVTASAFAAATAAIPVNADMSPANDIVILYTNDVHCGIDDVIGYDGLALYKREMEAEHSNVVLVDAGDAIQGGTVGTLSNGAYVTELMNFVGYDVAIPGNHEFDYKVGTFMQLASELDCGYICCNFTDIATGETMFAPYKIMDFGDTQVAFVGVTTPETFSYSTPIYFQNENGEYIYSFCEKEDELCTRIQENVDKVRQEGADHVILVGHLGEHGILEKWSAQTIVSKTSGIDAVIDGHSHEVTPSMVVKNKDNEDVIITQTGTKLNNIGKMTITDSGITAELISSVPAPDASMGFDGSSWSEADDREGRYVDASTNLKIHEIQARMDQLLAQVIGHTDFELYDSDPETGSRRVRNGETNLGDLCTDSFKELFGTDVAFINGGGIRKNIKSGDITYGDLINVFPYGNELCAARVTGQQLLDILEYGAAKYPEENGFFLSVSGMEYTIDENIPSRVKMDEHDAFIGVNGEYRVKNVKVGGEPLDLGKTYTVASIDYLLKKGGDGFIISGKCDVYDNSQKLDIDMFTQYITDLLGGNIPERYREPYGEGRIKIIKAGEVENTEPEPKPKEEPHHESVSVQSSYPVSGMIHRPAVTINAPNSNGQVNDPSSSAPGTTAGSAPAPQSSGDAAGENPNTGAHSPVAVITLSLISAIVIAKRKISDKSGRE